MMQPMHQMKLPPLHCGERTQYRMIQQSSARTKLLLASHDDLIHLRNLGPDLGQHLPRRQPSRTNHFRRFSTRGQMAKLHNDQGAAALRPVLTLRGQRLASLDHALKSLDRSGVGQIQVLQNLRGTPFCRRMRGHLFRRHAADRRSDFLLQFLKARVHAGYLPFPIFQLECCASTISPTVSQEGCHEDG